MNFIFNMIYFKDSDTSIRRISSGFFDNNPSNPPMEHEEFNNAIKKLKKKL